MERIAPYCCDLCRRPVDRETNERARQAWQPLVICEECVLGASDKRRAGPAQGTLVLAPAAAG